MVDFSGGIHDAFCENADKLTRTESEKRSGFNMMDQTFRYLRSSCARSFKSSSAAS